MSEPHIVVFPGPVLCAKWSWQFVEGFGKTRRSKGMVLNDRKKRVWHPFVKPYWHIVDYNILVNFSFFRFTLASNLTCQDNWWSFNFLSFEAQYTLCLRTWQHWNEQLTAQWVLAHWIGRLNIKLRQGKLECCENSTFFFFFFFWWFVSPFDIKAPMLIPKTVHKKKFKILMNIMAK